MTTQVQPRTDKTVRLALQADGVVCSLIGGAFIFASNAFSELFGIEAPIIILLFGIVTLVYGAAVWFFGNRSVIDPRLPMVTVTLNSLLVVLGIFLLVADPLTFTDAGKWAALILADGAALLAIWQFVGLRRMR